MKKTFVILLLVSLFSVALASCNSQPAGAGKEAMTSVEKTPLSVFAAGSLIIPFADVEKAFEAKYPHIDVQAEYHGSIQVIRHATELHKPIDVVVTADASLIPLLMYASRVPETNEPYADWYIRFASNHLALAYGENSLYSDEITAENWAEVIARPDVKIGIADPRFDASGYRALMAFALTEMANENYGLFAPMFDGQFSFPVTIFRGNDLTTITVPEILETKKGSHIVLRGSSVQLIALLQSGDLDYAFEYESVIRQHELNMVSLPAEVNLGEPEFETAYNQVQVNLDFQRFASVKPQFRGERIGYGVTIPASAQHTEEAALFIAFLLSDEGRAVMESNRHPLFGTFFADGYANLPVSLQTLTVPLE
ncbi:MAG TPA: tungstate ABC transporter substrate-binding protein WtpA [Anaerolineales bacterium]|nr:tungstate ABC transporter substrate-binding protein WtpA [Anaerolineales bacterium]